MKHFPYNVFSKSNKAFWERRERKRVMDRFWTHVFNWIIIKFYPLLISTSHKHPILCLFCLLWFLLLHLLFRFPSSFICLYVGYLVFFCTFISSCHIIAFFHFSSYNNFQISSFMSAFLFPKDDELAWRISEIACEWVFYSFWHLTSPLVSAFSFYSSN